ncbi:Arsenical pump membrane protein [Posidoniimonas polymericola]|uniref:Arsenical pump membrane protein n=1 Tax=Posidoniimonas polymericola TaxID=2528002 RepID=A0A5C5YT45_9BACT|nr:ArsB/NhaD family transporter [Posidoniimonas polymericola]TWT78172.1 Arsenical pump membrane protein [Posidoniimonas polymericola]
MDFSDTLLLAAAASEPIERAPAWVMILFALGMLATYVGVAVDSFHKTVAALLGAVVLVPLALALGVLPSYDATYEILSHDLNIFGVIIGTGILVDVTGRSGLFHFLSILMVKATGGRASALYFAICVLTFVFVAVLTIVPAMLILSSLVLVICRKLDYPPKPFLLSVAICANSGAVVTFASGLPNIMIGTQAGIPYVQFLMVSAPYALVSFLIALAVLRFAFRGSLPWKQSGPEQASLKDRIEQFDAWALVEDRRVLIRSAAILTLTVVGFALAQPLGVGMDFIAIAGGTAALLFAGKTIEDSIAKVNWTIILFFLGLFLIIGCVKETGALNWLADQVVALSNGSTGLLVALLTVFSAVASAIVDNIPVAATLIPVVEQIGDGGVAVEPLWWGTILGCNLGGNGTPIGSISCVIALYTLKKEVHETVSWGEFIRLGGTILVLQIGGAIAYLLALYYAGWIPSLPG